MARDQATRTQSCPGRTPVLYISSTQHSPKSKTLRKRVTYKQLMECHQTLMGALATHSALTSTSTTATTTGQQPLSRRSSLTLCSAESFCPPLDLAWFCGIK